MWQYEQKSLFYCNYDAMKLMTSRRLSVKTETLITVCTGLLIILLGLQTYTTFRLNDRLNVLIGASEENNPHQIRSPSLSKQSTNDEDFFKDRSWNPYEEMQHMQDEMEQMFGESFSRFHLHNPLNNLTKSPDIDLQSKPDSYIVTVNAPGADESSMKITLENQRKLHISIKTDQEKNESNNTNSEYQYRERFVGEFQRILTLPGPGDSEKLKTDYRNGVMTITIPKKQ